MVITFLARICEWRLANYEYAVKAIIIEVSNLRVSSNSFSCHCVHVIITQRHQMQTSLTKSVSEQK